jgi:hypothetical protein
LYNARSARRTGDAAVLQRAKETIRMARRGFDAALPRTRQILVLVDAYVQQQAGDHDGMMRTLGELEEAGPIQDASLVRFREELGEISGQSE